MEPEAPPAAPAEELTGVKAEKAAKKAAKQAEKEARKQKAFARETAAKVEVAPSSRRAKAKAEAEAKRAAEASEAEAWLAAVSSTPSGEMKCLSGAMPKAYQPKAVEGAWYEWWEKSGCFQAHVANPEAEPFVMVIPPPNVTGSLHIGHALMLSLEDTIARWRRMQGRAVVWVPGTDHAGIATQTVVERSLMAETGQTRHDLGRDKFLERVWAWVDRHGDRILYQLRRMGASLDWPRTCFTMDAKLSRAVQEAFLRLHASSKIYRAHRLVNWDCTLRTAVSDIEVDYVDVPGRTLLKVPGYARPVEFGVLTSFAYPLEDGAGEIVVATTRPETMLGDTAVAVHPEDERYRGLVGKFVVHPVNGRKIPVIADAELVDMAFGTGAVKITPAHDPNDFATGKRHNLEFVSVLDDEGAMAGASSGDFAGMPRFQARVAVVDWLKREGLFRGVADNPMRLGLCSRSKDVIEPVMKPQWWVDCASAAERAVDAVRGGDLAIQPREFEATWYRWLENIRDWCISRQLWWGHRIPAYYVELQGERPGAQGTSLEDTSRWVVAADEAAAREEAERRFGSSGGFALRQDEDVLDTWFSSGLFPFSVFGWPEESADLARFYPGALLETGHDILFFWVARMVMMGLELTDRLPFSAVYLHTIVRDAHGRKMSKSLGNVVDPLSVVEGVSLETLHASLEGGNLDPAEVEKARQGQKADFPDGIEECGTDALRFALVAYSSQGRDVNLDINRVVAYRHWCNKLWNAVRFALGHLGDDFVVSEDERRALANERGVLSGSALQELPFASRWILSRLSAAAETVDAGMEASDFSAATTAAYNFWQYELCDVFIELVKPVMARGGPAEQRWTRVVLWTALDVGLRLLHPFMPYVTEELWQRLRRPYADSAGASASISVSPFPRPVVAWRSAHAEARMALVAAVVARARGLRQDYGLVRERPALVVHCSSAEKAAFLSERAEDACTLADAASLEAVEANTASEGGQVRPKNCAVVIVDPETTLFMSLEGLVDLAKEAEKLRKNEAEALARIAALETKMAMLSYAQGTPESVKEADGKKLKDAKAELETAQRHLAEVQA